MTLASPRNSPRTSQRSSRLPQKFLLPSQQLLCVVNLLVINLILIIKIVSPGPARLLATGKPLSTNQLEWFPEIDQALAISIRPLRWQGW